MLIITFEAGDEVLHFSVIEEKLEAEHTAAGHTATVTTVYG